jgi:hypothetical protein
MAAHEDQAELIVGHQRRRLRAAAGCLRRCRGL